MSLPLASVCAVGSLDPGVAPQVGQPETVPVSYWYCVISLNASVFVTRLSPIMLRFFAASQLPEYEAIFSATYEWLGEQYRTLFHFLSDLSVWVYRSERRQDPPSPPSQTLGRVFNSRLWAPFSALGVAGTRRDHGSKGRIDRLILWFSRPWLLLPSLAIARLSKYLSSRNSLRDRRIHKWVRSRSANCTRRSKTWSRLRGRRS